MTICSILWKERNPGIAGVSVENVTWGRGVLNSGNHLLFIVAEQTVYSVIYIMCRCLNMEDI